VGQSVGILFAWIFLSCITLSLIQWFVRRKQAPSPAPTENGGGHERYLSASTEKAVDVAMDGKDREAEPIKNKLSAV
jgi:hypothetical protein